jgi:hypothetical protein
MYVACMDTKIFSSFSSCGSLRTGKLKCHGIIQWADFVSADFLTPHPFYAWVA